MEVQGFPLFKTWNLFAAKPSDIGWTEQFYLLQTIKNLYNISMILGVCWRQLFEETLNCHFRVKFSKMEFGILCKNRALESNLASSFLNSLSDKNS